MECNSTENELSHVNAFLCAYHQRLSNEPIGVKRSSVFCKTTLSDRRKKIILHVTAINQNCGKIHTHLENYGVYNSDI